MASQVEGGADGGAPETKEDGEITEAPHPTEHTWTFWEHKAAEKKTMTKAEWANLQTKLFTFATVEDFWKYYSHIPTPSAVFYDGKARKRVGAPPGDRFIESFSLFKEGIAPEWEDPQNISGGEWNLRKSGRGGEAATVDEWWQNLVLGLVGETIDDADNIAGARVVDKSGARGGSAVFRIELWLKTKDEKISKRLKEKMIEIMTEGKGGRNLSDQFQWKLHGL